MRARVFPIVLLAALASGATPVAAGATYWQCATFARSFSGLPIYGDAWTWWRQAEGRFARGSRPRVGAVLAFTPSGGMRLGHVATVTQVISAREITVTHANWSPLDGTRGRIERDVLIRDVSNDGDWSTVRVWFTPIAGLGTTAWPVSGFIYPERPDASAPRLRYADLSRIEVAQRLGPLGRDVMRLAMLEESSGVR